MKLTNIIKASKRNMDGHIAKLKGNKWMEQHLSSSLPAPIIWLTSVDGLVDPLYKYKVEIISTPNQGSQHARTTESE